MAIPWNNHELTHEEEKETRRLENVKSRYLKGAGERKLNAARTT